MIRNYIFDFGNVLARFSPEEMTSAYISDPETVKAVSAVVFDRLYWAELDRGTITDEEVKLGFCSRLPESVHKTACQIYDHWFELLPPIDGMQALVADIKRLGGKLFVISDISIGFAEGYHRNPWVRDLFAQFDGLVFSGPIGITKPNPEIFRYLLDRYSLDPQDCIFIDDRLDNVFGAEAVGIRGYRFDGNTQKLRKTLGIPEMEKPVELSAQSC